MARFAVQLVFGADRERRLEVRPAHREYLKGLAERGVLLAAGPWADDSGALLVYEVADRDELQRVLDEDPYTPAKVVQEITVREWTPVTGAWL
ncbi:MAG TPA: muconolactone Delta-isomerase family protein [Pseudonocardiaceae bacterium]